MKMHSDILGKSDVICAANAARNVYGQDIYIEDIRACGSRKRANGVTFYAGSLNGKRSQNGRDGMAATWTAYGYLIADLFRSDPNAIVGQYAGVEDFRRQVSLYVPRDGSIDFLDVLDYES